MAFVFDEHVAPDLGNWQRCVRFFMVDGGKRATCQVSYATLRELGPDEPETDLECLNQFYLHRGPITSAAARLLAAGAYADGTVVQILRANMP